MDWKEFVREFKNDIFAGICILASDGVIMIFDGHLPGGLLDLLLAGMLIRRYVSARK